MMKRLAWAALFACTLLLFTAALGAVAVPQTAKELPVPAYTLPAITDMQFSGSTASFAITGDYSAVSANFFVETPSGTQSVPVTFTLSGGRMTGSLADVLALGTDYYVGIITVDNNTPDYNMQFSYFGEGDFRDGRITNNHINEIFFLNFDTMHVSLYKLDNLTAFYDEDGNLNGYSISHANGSDEYSGDGVLLMSTLNDPITGRSTTTYYRNGAIQAQYIREADGTQSNYDANGTLRNYITLNPDGSTTALIYDTNGVLRNTRMLDGPTQELYDTAGTLLSRSGISGGNYFHEEYRDGVLFLRHEQVYSPDGWYTDTYENGVLVERSRYEDGILMHYDAAGNYTGKTVRDMHEEKTYNAKGHLTKTVINNVDYIITYDGKNNFLQLAYHDPYFSDEYLYDAKAGVWYFNGVLYDGPPPMDIASIRLRARIVWYPNNTVCSFGPQFRDIDPAMTDLWYMFTPIDLSKDGTQTFELIAGNMYVLGQAAVTVSGDSVTVTYATVKGKNGHVYMKSEYLNFFPDLQSVTTVVPEEIGPGFAFGKPISIEKDLKGDTNVLMFIRNVATFRNYVTNDTILRRYYKNYPSRKELRDEMLGLMD